MVGTDPTTPPLEMLVNGTVTGFDIDFFAAVAKIANLQYSIEQVPFVGIFADLLNNTLDIGLSGITITAARNLTYEFSVPYFISTHVILAKNDTNITGGQDLVNYKVAVRTGTTGYAIVVFLFGGNSSSPNILQYANQDDAIAALANGTADAYVDDSSPLIYYSNNNPGYVVIEDSNAFPKEFYGLMFPMGSSNVDPINSAITQVLTDGTYDSIYQTWFGTSPDSALLLEAGMQGNPYAVFVTVLQPNVTNA